MTNTYYLIIWKCNYIENIKENVRMQNCFCTIIYTFYSWKMFYFFHCLHHCLVLNALLFPFFTLKILPTFQSAYQGILFLEAVLVLFSDNLQHFSCYFFYDIFTLPLILWLFAFASYLPC